MLGIRINNGWLDMDPDTQINLRIISPAFSRELKDNSHTLSFSLPASPHNLKLTGFYDSPMVRNAQTTYTAELYGDLNIIEAGELDITLAGGEESKLTCKFRFGLSSVASAFKETKLVDIDLGGQRDIAGVAAGFADLNIKKLVDGLSAIKINGFTFQWPWPSNIGKKDHLDQFALMINVNASIHVDASVSGSGSAARLHLVPSVGFTQLDIDIYPPQNEQEWEIENQAGQGSAIHDAMIAHMDAVAAAAIGTYDYCFATVRNLNFYDGLNADYLGYVNLWSWSTGSYVKNTTVSGEAWRNTAIPFPKVAYLLDQAMSHFGLTNVSTFTSGTDFQKVHWWNNRSLDQERNDGSGDFNAFQSYIDLRDHIPEDMTVADLLVWVRDTFNVMIDINYDKMEVDFIPINELAENSEVDWREKTLIGGTIQRKPIPERGVTISYLQDDKDLKNETNLHQITFPDYITSSGYRKIESKISPVFRWLEPHPIDSGAWWVPDISQVGQSPYSGLESNLDYNLRSFLWCGMQQSSTSNTYPYGTNDIYDHKFNIINSWSLLFHNPGQASDAYSLVNTFFEPLLTDTEEEAEIDQLFLLNLLDLLEMDYLKPQRIRCKEGDVRTLLRQLNVTLGMNGLVSSTANLLRI